MPGGRRTLAAAGTLTRPKEFVNKRIRPQLPLVEDTSKVERYVLTDHAIERAEERGVGIMEVYSTLAEPTSIRQNGSRGTTDYLRGDLRVTVDEKGRSILTVVDLDEDIRMTPRIPLNPLFTRKATTMPRTKANDSLDEAWCLVPHSEPDMRKVFISPALAEKLLSLNTHNRPLRKSIVAQYVSEIEEGRWVLTHQGVALDSTPALQDGQHRLTAIVETGQGQWMFVAVGMAPDNFAKVDTGLNRRYADVLAMGGFGDPFNLGASARLVFIYLNKDFNSSHKVTNAQVLELVSQDVDGFTISMQYGGRTSYGIFAVKSAASAAHYLIQRANNKAPVVEFFEGLIEGTGLPSGDPRLALRRLMANSFREGGRRSGGEHLALIIKTWNAWAEGKELRNLSWKKNEPMPRVTRYERKR